MLDFLKNLVRKEEKPRDLALRFEDIPSMLERERQVAASRLSTATEGERTAIRDAAGRLQDVIHILLSARFEEGIHPKLRSIAQKSLPLYTRAVGAALEKPLPPAPDEFYAAAAELLKTCINSAQGQGKYLRTAFPEEMKAVAACVAEIGRAINAMNQPVGEYRAAIARIEEAARLHTALADINADLIKSAGKEVRLAGRAHELRGRLEVCRRAAGELERERQGPEIAGREAELLQRKADRDQAARAFAALSMTGAHVLRKAEKVAHRQQKQADAKTIARAIPLLSDHAVPHPEELVASIKDVFGIARRMIDAGEVALKNREERALFASMDAFTGELAALSHQYCDLAARCDAMERALGAHPVIARIADLDREIRALSETLAKEEEAYAGLIQWREHLAGTIPSLREELKKVAGMIWSGSDVQIHYPDN